VCIFGGFERQPGVQLDNVGTSQPSLNPQCVNRCRRDPSLGYAWVASHHPWRDGGKRTRLDEVWRPKSVTFLAQLSYWLQHVECSKERRHVAEGQQILSANSVDSLVICHESLTVSEEITQFLTF
jgi:hypothetical protein